jgi:hypothetical protein
MFHYRANPVEVAAFFDLTELREPRRAAARASAAASASSPGQPVA